MLQPAQMNPSGQHTAAPDGAVTFWANNGALEGQVAVAKGSVTVWILAEGTLVDADYPVLDINLDNRAVGRIHIDSPSPREYTIATTLDHTGSVPLRIAVVNQVSKPEFMRRNLTIRTVWVSPPI